MKISGQNSLALPSDVAKLVGKPPADVGIFEPGRFSDSSQAIHFLGTRLLETMKMLGQRATFERKIQLHVDPAMKLAFRLTGNWDAAEELVQETMLRAVSKWQTFRQQAQFKTWLYRILINAFRDQIRKQSRSHHWTTDHESEYESRETNVAAQAETNELSQIAARMIAELPERQKEVLILSTYESLSNAQIAETLGISLANVHSNLCAARKRLKQKLGKYLNP